MVFVTVLIWPACVRRRGGGARMRMGIGLYVGYRLRKTEGDVGMGR